jgi:hypothetical protein
MDDFSSPEDALFRCEGNKGGAFLSLPFECNSVDAIRTKAFETYTRKHCDSWLEFAIVNSLDARLEDIILVTGCDVTSSWAMAAFVNPLHREQEITLSVMPGTGDKAESATFTWSQTGQPHNYERRQVR